MMTFKTCGRCKAEKPTSEFNRFARATDGLQRWCRQCGKEYQKGRYEADPERYREASRNWYRSIPAEQKPAANRRSNLTKFRLTPEQFDQMLAAQGGKCALCSTTEPGGRHNQWHIDHDHACCPGQRTCGKCVRAILCPSCNSGLGYFADDVDRLMAAAAYLLQFQNVLSRGDRI